MSANFNTATGKMRQLDRLPEPITPLEDQQVQDPPTLIRILMGLLRDTTRLLAAWSPQRIDFEGLVSAGTNVAPQRFRLPHGFAGNVRWWVVDTQAAGVVAVTLINRVLPTDLNVLTLDVYYAATLTIRVEEAG